jgi:hypothetical protein
MQHMTINPNFNQRDLLQMVRSLAVAARLKAQRVIQDDLTLATLAGTLFRTAINVS